MKLIWRQEALDDRNNIIEYIAEHDVAAADRLDQRIINCSQRLLVTPSMYRPGRIDGTREAVIHPNYILVYRVTDDVVEIVNIIHARRKYP